MSPQGRSASKIIWGIIYVILGLIIYLWVNQHSPHMGFGEMMTNLGSYYIKEPLYTIIILVAAILGLNGVVLLIRGVVAEAKHSVSTGSQAPLTNADANPDVIEKLERLATLKEKGLLSQTEFDEQKHRLLNGK